MQSEAQTTPRGSLAVSAGALEIATVIQGALEVLWLYLYLLVLQESAHNTKGTDSDSNYW